MPGNRSRSSVVAQHTTPPGPQPDPPSADPPRVAAALHQLRSSGNRRTLLRSAVISTLGNSPEHRTGAELCEVIAAGGLPVDYSTVLRTVGDLADLGIVCTVRTSNVRRFGLSRPSHHHAVCEECGLITEVPVGSVETVTPALARASGLDLRDGHLLISGRCTACTRPVPDA
ncbi:MAG: Fur family transcriptional regulator [Pseudonocardia sp.]